MVEDDPWTVGGSEVAEMASWERERHSDHYGMGSQEDKPKSKVTTEVDETWLKQIVGRIEKSGRIRFGWKFGIGSYLMMAKVRTPRG